MRVAFDGSPLIDQPNSPLSIHAIEWLNLLHKAGFELALIHPPGQLPPLPEHVETFRVQRGSSGWGRLRYEQRKLPYVARELSADVLLVGEGHAPISSPVPMVSIASLGRSHRSAGPMGALLDAAGQAGSGGASAHLSPSDTTSGPQVAPYTPFVSPDFSSPSDRNEGDHVLCFGVNPSDAEFILSAWTYVDGSLGDTYPLLFLGADRHFAGEVERFGHALDVMDSIQVESETGFSDVVRKYHSAAAYLGTSFEAGGQALRWALATGTPVVGLKTPQFDSVVGNAAYLVPPADSRILGAAMLTVLVQERVSKPLREEGLKAAASYATSQTGEEIATILRSVVNHGRGAKPNGQ